MSRNKTRHSSNEKTGATPRLYKYVLEQPGPIVIQIDFPMSTKDLAELRAYVLQRQNSGLVFWLERLAERRKPTGALGEPARLNSDASLAVVGKTDGDF